MKTNLFKTLKNFLFLPLFTLILFASCQNEVSDIIETNTEETFVAQSALATSMLRTTMFDGSFDNIIDSANCISVNLPVTVVVNGITVTIEEIEDYDVIEDILDEFLDDEDSVEIVFPITIMLSNYDEIVINNYDELYAFVEECLGENEEDDDIEVPFAIIEDIPIVPGCEKVSKKKQRDCFQEKINKHIRKNFRYPEIAQEMGIQGRVYVSFIIGKDGKVIMVQPRGPNKNLEKEAQRIIERLPQMIPGKQRGKAVRVPYSIPITFRLQ